MDKEELIAALKKALAEKDQVALESLAKEAVSTYADEAFGYYYLAESLALEVPARLAEAEICLAKALEIEADNVDYLCRFAQLKDKQGKFEDAQIIWSKVLKTSPNHIEALVAKATFRINAYQDFEEGLELLNQAIENAESLHIQAHWQRALAYNGLEKSKEALADANIVLGEGFDESATVLKITLLKDLGQLADTLALYQELLEEVPDKFSYQFNYGKELLEQQQYEAAAQQLKKAAELLTEEHPLFYQTLGQACLYALQLDAALAAFDQCLVIDPENYEVALLRIQTLMEMEQYDKALAAIDTLLHQDLDDTSLEERLLIQKGMALIATDKLKEAQKVLTPLAKKTGLRQKDAYYGLGVAFHQQEDLGKAYKFLKAAKATGHPLAAEYINAHLIDYLQKLQERAMQANEAAYDKNADSVLQACFGKLWRFKDLDSQNMADFSEQQKETVKEDMQNFSLLMTEKGVLLLSDDQEEKMTYRIKKEASKGALVEFLPLDNFPPFVAKLQLEGKDLTFSREKGEVMHLQAEELATVPETLAKLYQQKVNRSEVAFLGDKAAAVLDGLLE